MTPTIDRQTDPEAALEPRAVSGLAEKHLTRLFVGRAWALAWRARPRWMNPAPPRSASRGEASGVFLVANDVRQDDEPDAGDREDERNEQGAHEDAHDAEHTADEDGSEEDERTSPRAIERPTATQLAELARVQARVEIVWSTTTGEVRSATGVVCAWGGGNLYMLSDTANGCRLIDAKFVLLVRELGARP